VLDAFVAAGFNLVDTADVYSIFVKGHVGGESESTIGRWLEKRGRRDDVVIATKVGMDMGPAGKGLSREHIVAAAEASAPAKTDYIDLYQAHMHDKTTPLDARRLRDLIAAAVTARWRVELRGRPVAAALRTSETLGLPRFETMQPWYNLYDRVSFEGPLQDLCRREGLGVIPYFGLASGFLTGKYRSEKDLAGSARAYRVKTMLNERGFKILAALDAAAAAYDATPAQIALAWLRAHGVVAPIASATSARQLEELAGFARIHLEHESVAKLDAASVGGEPPPAW
jgi:aryl-alcohol dehydrogenase-like predicted oxidoreductase